MSNNPTDSEETVFVEWDDKDYLANLLGVADVPLEIEYLTRSEIRRFCAGCDNLSEHGVCNLGLHDQTRYVARKWCGWAMKNEKRG